MQTQEPPLPHLTPKEPLGKTKWETAEVVFGILMLVFIIAFFVYMAVAESGSTAEYKR